MCVRCAKPASDGTQPPRGATRAVRERRPCWRATGCPTNRCKTRDGTVRRRAAGRLSGTRDEGRCPSDVGRPGTAPGDTSRVGTPSVARMTKNTLGTQQGLTRLVCSHSETWGAKPLPRTRPKGLFLPMYVHGNPRFAKQEHHCDQAEGSPDTWKPAQDQSTRKWEPRPEWTTQAARCHAVVRERRSDRRQEKETLNHPDYGERAVNL